MKGDQISTKLIVENKTDRVNCVEYKTMTEEEKMLSEHAEKLMDDKSDDTDDIDQVESSVEFDPSSMIRDGEERSGEKTSERGRGLSCESLPKCMRQKIWRNYL